jgi:type III pantothenate kinase
MTPLVVVALGNSTAALGLASGERLVDVIRVPLARLEDLKKGFARVRREAPAEAVPVVAASVNPPALDRFRRLVADLVQKLPEVAGVDFPIPIRADVDEPERVGADRLLGALAAYRRVGGACVTVDCGTAITVNGVTRDGVFAGGAILPGPDLMARSLSGGTALLPTVEPAGCAPLLGRSTEQAMAAGVLRGAAGAVAAPREVVGADAPVLVTGGAADRLKEYLPPDCRTVTADLVLEGLVIAYRQWQSR